LLVNRARIVLTAPEAMTVCANAIAWEFDECGSHLHMPVGGACAGTHGFI